MDRPLALVVSDSEEGSIPFAGRLTNPDRGTIRDDAGRSALGQWRARRWWIITLLAASLVLGSMAVAKGPQHLIEFTHSEGCWGGALSEDPLHCYVLEEAQREGLITVDGVFVVGRLLRMYVTEDDLPDEELVEFLVARGHEFIDRWPGRVSYNLKYSYCHSELEAAYAECVLRDTFWAVPDINPWDSPYANIMLWPGGSESRFTKGGMGFLAPAVAPGSAPQPGPGSGPGRRVRRVWDRRDELPRVGLRWP